MLPLATAVLDCAVASVPKASSSGSIVMYLIVLLIYLNTGSFPCYSVAVDCMEMFEAV